MNWISVHFPIIAALEGVRLLGANAHRHAWRTRMCVAFRIKVDT